ncbi:MAG TPA: Hsp20/alpha crystallin family protein [Bacteroidia bacterium]|nr:Hsp20/alpha crystallin family protein [Bacteroidia bacterium]
MALIKWTKPTNGLLRRDLITPSLENLFHDFFNNELMVRDYAGYVPSTNITEDDTSFTLEMYTPGFDKKDFNLKIENGILTVTGEHKTEASKNERNFIRKEFNYGSFSRSFNVADLVDEEKIDAKYENGILKLVLPKNEKARPSAKEIKVS